MQAKEDNRLGRFHYDLLMEQQFNIQAHLIETLTHSRNRVNLERDELIVKWIEEKIL